MKTIIKFTSLFVLLVVILSSVGVTPAHSGGGILYVKPSPTGWGTCGSWANACTLQMALIAAVSGNHIWVIAGTHKPTTGTDRTATFQLKSGVSVLGGFNGTEPDTGENLRDPVKNVTILSGEIGAAGNNDNSYHVTTGATDATLDGFTITDGNANGDSPNNRGGGMYNKSSNPILTNVIFSGNSAFNGGGMYNENSNPVLTNIVFYGNTSPNLGNGGGMSNASSSPTLTNVTFSSNSADNWGGGMFNDSNSSNPVLTNVTFYGNSAVFGGGMYNWCSSTMLTLTNVTFSGNSAVNGGGMCNQACGHPTINNTIFWGNSATYGSQIDNIASTPILSDNVIQGGCPDGSTCTHIISADPMLGSLGNYGGFTQTIPLLPGSSAVDMGNDTICPATDQRGLVRPQRAHCDIGAYEARANDTITIKSSGAQDGWILENLENGNAGMTLNSSAATLRLGDDAKRKQYRSVLSFNTGPNLPDTAFIIKVTLKIMQQGIVGGGNPLAIFQGFMVDVKKGVFGNATLQAADWQATANKTIGPFTSAASGGWYTLELPTAKAFINILSTNGGLTQIRLRFKLDDNNNSIANYLSLYSGNAGAASRPQLIIEYYVP